MTYATILVNLEAGQSNAHLLQVAREVADRFQAGVIGSTACAPVQMMYGDGYSYGDIVEQDRTEIDREIKAAEAEFRDAMGAQPPVLGWRPAVLVTPLSDHLASAASQADLVLTSAGPNGPFNPARQISTGELIMQAGRPVLLVGPPTRPFRMDRVMIAWKNTREARRAVADALPLLRKASHVSLVEIAEDGDLDAARQQLNEVAAWLERHGVAAHAHASPASGDDSVSLDAVAYEQDADIVVAGAYGHSRIREWALGGVTRGLLKHPVRSAFVSH